VAPEAEQALETFHKDCQRLVLVAEEWLAWPAAAAAVEDIAAVAVEGTVVAAAAAGTVEDTFAEGLKQGEEVAEASAAAADRPGDQLDKPGTVDQLRQL